MNVLSTLCKLLKAKLLILRFNAVVRNNTRMPCTLCPVCPQLSSVSQFSRPVVSDSATHESQHARVSTSTAIAQIWVRPMSLSSSLTRIHHVCVPDTSVSTPQSRCTGPFMSFVHVLTALFFFCWVLKPLYIFQIPVLCWVHGLQIFSPRLCLQKYLGWELH